MLEAKLQKESRYIKINPLKLKDIVNSDRTNNDTFDTVFDKPGSLVRSQTEVNLDRKILAEKTEIPKCLIDFKS